MIRRFVSGRPDDGSAPAQELIVALEIVRRQAPQSLKGNMELWRHPVPEPLGCLLLQKKPGDNRAKP